MVWVPKVLWHLRPTLQTNTLLYTCPTWANAEDKASVDEAVIYVANVGGWWASDTITIWTHIKWEPADTTNATAIAYYQNFTWTIVIKLDGIKLNEWDTVYIRSQEWYCSFTLYWNEIYGLNEIERLKKKIIAWTSTGAEDAEYALLLGWSIQTNVNNCNCP